MTHVTILDSILIAICIIFTITEIHADTNRTGRLFKGVANTNGLNDLYGTTHDDISRYGISSASGYPNIYIDYGLVPFGVNVPPRTYLPPPQWPDQSAGYPPAQRPSPPPPPPASYLPPKPPPIATTTEFTLPEVIDARKPTLTANTKNSAGDPKLRDDDQNRNRWTDNTNAYRGGYAAERVKLIEMQCDNGPEGRLRAILQWNFGGASGFPMFEDSTGGRLGGDGCAVSVERASGEPLDGEGGAKVHVDVASASFTACGVQDCEDGERASYLCTRLRFPQMEGLRLADDVVLTLRCRIQEPIAIHTKHFHLPVSSAVAGRSAGVFATGGASNEVRCELEVLRRGPSQQFSSRLTPGAQVLLGEELLIRLTVADGEGWRHSRLGEVSLAAEGAEGAEGAGARVSLLTAEGCVAAGASAICPQPPRRETALSHSLIIRAPMFEGSAPSGGAIVLLSVRVVACRRAQACTSRCARASRSLSLNRTGRGAGGPGPTASDFANNLGRDPLPVSQEINSIRSDYKGAEKSPIKNYRGGNNKTYLRDAVVINYINDAKVYVDKIEENPDNGQYYKAHIINERNNEIKDNNLYVHESDNISHAASRRVRRKRASVPNTITADSVASVNFTVIMPTPNKKGYKITEGVNDKPVTMIIVLAGFVSVLIVAVAIVHNRRKPEPKIETQDRLYETQIKTGYYGS